MTTSSDSTVKLWNLDGFTLERTLKGHRRWVWDCVFSVDAAFLVTASSDATARLWEVRLTLTLTRPRTLTRTLTQYDRGTTLTPTLIISSISGRCPPGRPFACTPATTRRRCAARSTTAPSRVPRTARDLPQA